MGGDPTQQSRWCGERPGMSEVGLGYYQEDAVRAVEQAIVNGQQHILLALATVTGKPRTAIALISVPYTQLTPTTNTTV